MDIRIINHGTIVQLMPLSERASVFLQHELESEGWQWMGRTLCVDPRFVEGIVDLAIDHDLEIGG